MSQEKDLKGALSTILPSGAGCSVAEIPDRGWPRRATESAIGRLCAMDAAAAAGALAPRFMTNAVPEWPEGFVGSISHTRRFAIAACARTDACRSIGIDIEPTMSFTKADRVAGWIATPAERRACGGSPDLLTLLFSAKESVFKCLHPIVRTWFDFDHAEIVRWSERALTISLVRDLGPLEQGTAIEVLYARASGHVVTVATTM